MNGFGFDVDLLFDDMTLAQVRPPMTGQGNYLKKCDQIKFIMTS